MKKILTALAFFVSLATHAQDIDSTKIPQTITLKRSHFGFIKSCISTNDQPARVNLFRQVASQVTQTYNPNQLITVQVESGTVVEVFQAMGQQQDYYSNAINDSIQAALVPQITNPWLGAQLYAISVRNQQETARRIMQGDDFFLATKPD